MAYQEADIDAMLSDSQSTFTTAGVTQPCIFIENDHSYPMGKTGSGHMLTIGHVLIKASAFPNLKVGDAVMLNNVNFKAKTVDLVQDGGMLDVMLGQ